MRSEYGMNINHIIPVVSFLLATTILCHSHGSFNVSDDTYFEIKWPGPVSTPILKQSSLEAPEEEDEANGDSLLIRADAQSSYRCFLPSRVHNQKYRKTVTDYTGPGPLALLRPLFEQKACSYKIESYWTYELCHGKHLRQYHEEMEGEKTHKKMEFFLGFYQGESEDHPPAPSPVAAPAPDGTQPAEQQPPKPEAPAGQEAHTEGGQPAAGPPTISIEGTNFPYFQVNFSGGSVCDLTKEPRQVSLLYICLESGRGEIYELVEVESCKYRVVVMSKLLCQHPAYTVVRPHVNSIKCRPADARSPVKPMALVLQEVQTQQQQERGHTSTLEGLFGREVKIEATRDKDRVLIRIGSKRKEEEPREEAPQEPEPGAQEPAQPPAQQPQQPPPVHPPALLLRSFVKGADCVVGGAGWWRHELCYGRSVVQYHDDAQTGKRTTIVLGKWHQKAHLQWLAANPQARPVKERQFSHYFTEGDRCDETKRSRAVEVRIRCLKDSSTSSSAMSIMLQEPRLCQYVLTVESAMLCPLVNQVDDNGLLPDGFKLD